MAIITTSELISTIKGSIGSTTFSVSRAGLIAKRKSGTHKNYTNKQANVIKNHVFIIQEWQKLTLDQQLLWDDYATTYTQINRWGVVTNLTGLQWFSHMNNLKYPLDQTILEEPPARVAANPIPSFTLDIDPNGINIIFDSTINQPEEILYIFATLPNQLTNNTNRGKLRLVKVIESPNISSVDITEDWENYFNLDWNSVINNSLFKIQVCIYSVNIISWMNSVQLCANGISSQIVGTARITEDSITRITEDNNIRVIE